MNQPRIPSLDFAFFSMTSRLSGELLGWEVTMLDVELFRDPTQPGAEQHAQSMPLLIGEVTELLEGPLLRLVVKQRLKLWLPISYSAFGDSEWVDGLVEQLSGPAELRRGVALLVRWIDLPAPLVELRANIDRLRAIGLRAVDTSHGAVALTVHDDPDGVPGQAQAPTDPADARAWRQVRTLDGMKFGAAINLANVLRQLR